MFCILRALRCLPRGFEYGNETSGTTQWHRVRCTAAAGALALLAALGRAGPDLAATLVIHVQTPDGHALAGAVVTARPLDGQAKRPAPVHAVMDQVNRAFAPDLLVVPVGSTVAFPNSDSVSHQIYSFSAAKRFQLPLYHGKPYRQCSSIRPE